MADLRANAVTKLATVSGVSLASAAATTLYNVPTGKTFIPTMVVIRSVSATAAAATSVALGANSATFDDWLAAFSLVNLDATTKCAIIRDVDSIASAIANSISVSLMYTAGQAFSMKVTTGAAGVTATVDIFGYLF